MMMMMMMMTIVSKVVSPALFASAAVRYVSHNTTEASLPFHPGFEFRIVCSPWPVFLTCLRELSLSCYFSIAVGEASYAFFRKKLVKRVCVGVNRDWKRWKKYRERERERERERDYWEKRDCVKERDWKRWENVQREKEIDRQKWVRKRKWENREWTSDKKINLRERERERERGSESRSMGQPEKMEIRKWENRDER